MKASKKIELIDLILERYDDGVCFYCGGVLNGDLEGPDFNEFEGNDFCNYCGGYVDKRRNWEESCLDAIDKVIHDEDFKP
jgi:hypothetical protein